MIAAYLRHEKTRKKGNGIVLDMLGGFMGLRSFTRSHAAAPTKTPSCSALVEPMCEAAEA